jgi:hypothetical protein
MRRAARVDVNQPAIVEALRAVGASVQPLHMVGKGCPDLLVAFRGDTFVFEVKDGAKPPSQRRLTPDEAQWHTGWQAPVYVVESVEDALRVIGATE